MVDISDLDVPRGDAPRPRRVERRRVERRRMIVFVEHDRRRSEDRRTGIDRRRIGRWPRLAPEPLVKKEI